MSAFLRSIIFDWNRTLFDPDTSALDPAAAPVTRMLAQRGFRLVLFTRREQGREAMIDSTEIRGAFDDVIVVNRKSVEALRAYLAGRGIAAPSCVMVGDRVREEIAIGNTLGMRTVWVKKGKFSVELPRERAEVPTITVPDLSTVPRVVLRKRVP